MTMQTFMPIQYLKIDVANSFGLDRDDWDVRLNWFDENEEQLLEVPSMGSQMKSHPLVKLSDNPALFLAGIMAYEAAKNGQVVRHPVSLDATASGAQLLSLLIGCEKSALSCNVLDSGKREDLYTNAYHGIVDRLIPEGSDNPILDATMEVLSQRTGISRKDAKQAIMTSLYGSTAKPREVFGEGAQLQAFFATMEEDFTGIWDLNKKLLELWDPEALSNDWVMPDNFHVQIKVMDTRTEYAQFLGRNIEVTTKVNRATESGRSLPANITHGLDGMVVREISRRCTFNATKISHLLNLLRTGNFDLTRGHSNREQDKLVIQLWYHYEQSGFLSARILELLDEENLYLVDAEVIRSLVLTLPERPFHVLSTHDCFRVLPNYCNDLRRQYNQILSDIAKSDMLKFIVSQITGNDVIVHKYDDFQDRVLESNYALS